MPKGWTIWFSRFDEGFQEGIRFLFDQSINSFFPAQYIGIEPGREKRESSGKSLGTGTSSQFTPLRFVTASLCNHALPSQNMAAWTVVYQSSSLSSQCSVWSYTNTDVKALSPATMISPTALNMFSPSPASSEDIGSSALFPSLDTGLSTSGMTSEEVDEQAEGEETE